MMTKKMWRLALAVTTAATAAVVLTGCSMLTQMTEQISEVADPGEGTTQDIFSLKVGDCENNSQTENEISSTKVIDCAEPHDTEIFAAIYVPDGEFPGDAAIEAQAEPECFTQFESFIGANHEDSIYNYSWYYPTEASWRDGDREILCIAYHGEFEKITGSLAGVAQ